MIVSTEKRQGMLIYDSVRQFSQVNNSNYNYNSKTALYHLQNWREMRKFE